MNRPKRPPSPFWLPSRDHFPSHVATMAWMLLVVCIFESQAGPSLWEQQTLQVFPCPRTALTPDS